MQGVRNEEKLLQVDILNFVIQDIIFILCAQPKIKNYHLFQCFKNQGLVKMELVQASFHKMYIKYCLHIQNNISTILITQLKGNLRLFSAWPVTAKVFAAKDACTFGLLKWMTEPSSLIILT